MSDQPIESPIPAATAGPPDHDAIALGTGAAGSRRSRLRVTAGAALVTAAVVVALVVATGGSPGAVPSAAAASTVRHAVVATVRAGALSFQLTEHESVASEDIVLHGTGSCSIGKEACDLSSSITSPLSATPLTVRELVVGSSTYLRLGEPLTSELSIPTPWVSMPFSKSLAAQSKASSLSTLSANPLSGLAALARTGYTVTGLGSSTAGGVRTSEYEVQLSSGALTAKLHSFEDDMPAWMRPGATAVSGGSITEDVWISGGRLRQLGATASLQVDGQSVNLAITMVITHYGGTVDVVAPPAREVTPFSKVLPANGV